MNWRETLDDVLGTEPGPDLTFLDDRDLVARLAERAMTKAAVRLHAEQGDLDAVLDVLLAETNS